MCRTADRAEKGQVRLQSDVSTLDWFVVTAERIPGKSYGWYVNGKLYKQVLAPGGVPKEEEKGRHNRLECALQHSFV
jgi:hypothetical protein